MDYLNGRLFGVGSINTLQHEVDELKVTKQDTLKSEINIKTINGNSILGEGNIDITGESGYLSEDLTTTVSVGGISSGTTFPAGTSLESILRALLCPENSANDLNAE